MQTGRRQILSQRGKEQSGRARHRVPSPVVRLPHLWLDSIMSRLSTDVERDIVQCSTVQNSDGQCIM